MSLELIKRIINIKTVSSIITEKLRALEGIVDPKVNIGLPARGGIIINTESKINKDININVKAKEIKKITSNFAKKKLGFKVIKSNYTASGFIDTEIQKVMDYYNIENKPETDYDKLMNDRR